MGKLRPYHALPLVAAGLALAVAATPACSKARPAPEAPATTAAPASEAPARGARALGLTKVEGSTPVDVQITAAQKMIGQFPDLRDNWIALGRLWVRKAREAADPGFYLYARACADVS